MSENREEQPRRPGQDRRSRGRRRAARRRRAVLRWIRRNRRPLLLRAAMLAFLAVVIIVIVTAVRTIRSHRRELDETAAAATTIDAPEWESVTYTNAAASYTASAFLQNGDFMSYEDENYTSVQGVDVSSYSGQVDWEAAKEAGIRFAFIRLGYRGYTEGGIMQDAMYETNMRGCAAAEIPVGVYFYSQAVNEEEAREEADFCIARIQDYELSLPVIYDPEEAPSGTARTAGLTGEQITANALAFLDEIRKAGYTAGLYANREWEKNVLDMTQFQDTIVWFAGFTRYPESAYHFEFWQYSHTGHPAGFASDVEVDMDIRLVPRSSTGS